MGQDFFLKIQKTFTSKQMDDIASSYEGATVNFHIHKLRFGFPLNIEFDILMFNISIFDIS